MGKKVIGIVSVIVVLALASVACTNSETTPTAAPTSSAKTTPTAAPTSSAKTTPTAAPTSTEAPAEGVTALQVQQLIMETFNTSNRDLTLWEIQPGLGTVMIEYGKRFATVKQAADAGDWGMAQYQLKEQVEIQEVGEATRPGKAELLANFEHTYLDPLADAIVAMDTAKFNKAYDDAVAGCNQCHVGTGHADTKFTPTSVSPQAFLVYAPSQSVAPGEESGHAAAAPAAEKALSWQELYDMVNAYFDTSDRSLTLWNIQPGLGTVMIEYGKRFAMVKQAADAGDWGMAQYQLKEQIEIQEVGEATRPGKADLLANFEHTYLDPVGDAIVAMDTAKFNKAYDDAVAGCNQCHVGTGHAYVRFQEPSTSPQPFLDLAASESVAPGPEGSHDLAPWTAPGGTPTLEDARAMITDRMNNIDRGLTLWNIQPGLGTIMMEYGQRFAMAKLAVDAGNWDHAAYQLKEAVEYQEVGETTRPKNAELLAGFERSALQSVTDAVDAKDKAAFGTAYASAIGACNACHGMTGHGYVRFQAPTESPEAFLDLAGN